MEESVKQQFGNRIQKIRKEIGVSQEKFALKIDMDRPYLASVENGHRNISVRNIQKIANGLGITLSELFKGI